MSTTASSELDTHAPRFAISLKFVQLWTISHCVTFLRAEGCHLILNLVI